MYYMETLASRQLMFTNPEHTAFNPLRQDADSERIRRNLLTDLMHLKKNRGMLPKQFIQDIDQNNNQGYIKELWDNAKKSGMLYIRTKLGRCNSETFGCMPVIYVVLSTAL